LLSFGFQLLSNPVPTGKTDKKGDKPCGLSPVSDKMTDKKSGIIRQPAGPAEASCEGGNYEMGRDAINRVSTSRAPTVGPNELRITNYEYFERITNYVN
jgi:hypothetical protein